MTQKKPKRTDIPVPTRDFVLREAGYKCGNPACRNILTLQLHHVVWVKDGGSNESSNLLALCAYCHDQHTHGHIPASAIRHWKGLLVALNHAFSKESMDLLLFLDVPGASALWYSGDGVLHFAGLIAAGLVEIKRRVPGGGRGGTRVRFIPNGGDPPPAEPPPSHACLVGLTDKGQLLVDSWKKGDEAGYVRALASPPHAAPHADDADRDADDA